MPECCEKYADAVFVFGSNESGIHGRGAEHEYRLAGPATHP